jgi:hypothetical protein
MQIITDSDRSVIGKLLTSVNGTLAPEANFLQGGSTL